MNWKKGLELEHKRNCCSATGDDLNWRTQLNPVGWGTKNCTAYGYVYDY